MGNQNSGFEIKAEQRQSWKSIAMVWAGGMICVPCLMIGGVLSSGGLSILEIILSILIGYGLICAYMIFIGILCLYSYDNELSDSMNLLFAMWSLSCGTAQIAASVQIRSLEYTKWWRILICGIVNILCFVFFIVDPFSDFLTLYISFGAYLIISSVICFSELFNYNTTLN